jgi:hypothetical protein
VNRSIAKTTAHNDDHGLPAQQPSDHTLPQTFEAHPESADTAAMVGAEDTEARPQHTTKMNAVNVGTVGENATAANDAAVIDQPDHEAASIRLRKVRPVTLFAYVFNSTSRFQRSRSEESDEEGAEEEQTEGVRNIDCVS